MNTNCTKKKEKRIKKKKKLKARGITAKENQPAVIGNGKREKDSVR